MEKSFGFDDYTISYDLVYIDNKRMRGLYAIKDGDSKEKGILLFAHERIGGVINKLIHMDKQELAEKISSFVYV